MLNKMMIPFVALFFCSIANAAISVPDQAQIGAYNVIPKNAGAEQSTSGWTASGGTLTTITSAGNVGFGNASFSWDSNAASQTLTSEAIAVPSGFVNGSGQQVLVLSFVAKCASGTCTHTFLVDDGSTPYSSAITVVSSTTNFVPQRVRFNVGSAGNIRIRVSSVASNEPAIYLDGFQIQPENRVGIAFSGATEARKEGSAKIDCDGSPSILRNRDNMAASVSGSSGSGCTVTFTTGYFSEEPECVAGFIDNAGNINAFSGVANVSSVSSSSVTVYRQLFNEAGGSNFIQTQDGDFTLFCRGLP